MYRFMLVYIGDANPILDRWTDEVANLYGGERLGDSYCLFSGTRNIQFGFDYEGNADQAKGHFDRADLSTMGESYYLETTKVTNKGWVYPPPVAPVNIPYKPR